MSTLGELYDRLNALREAEGKRDRAKCQYEADEYTRRNEAKRAHYEKLCAIVEELRAIPAGGDAMDAAPRAPAATTEQARATPDPQAFYELIRGFGYTTHAQSMEIAVAVADHLATTTSGGEARLAQALHAAVSAIYFDDSSKFKGALGRVVHTINPTLAGELLCHPKAAFDKSAAREVAALAAKGHDDQ